MVGDFTSCLIGHAETWVGRMGCGHEGQRPSAGDMRNSGPPYPSAVASKEAFLLPVSSNLVGMARRVRGCKCSLACRDNDHLVMTLRIDLPSRDGTLRDKHVDPEPRDEMRARSLRPVHVIPGDFHPVHPPILKAGLHEKPYG